MFPLAKAFADEVITVSDDEISDAQRDLWRELRIAAEPGGATALASITSGRYQPGRDENVAIIICGGNTDAVSL